MSAHAYLDHQYGKRWTDEQIDALLEDVAAGLTTYAEVERALGLTPDTLAHRVKVLRGANATFNRRSAIVMECLESFGPLTAEDLADELHWTQRTARRWLVRLEEQGAVVREVPESPCEGHRWRLRDGADQDSG